MQRCRPVGGGISPRTSEDECGKCFPVTSDVAFHHGIDSSPASCATLGDRSVKAIAYDETCMHRQLEVTLVKSPVQQRSEVRSASLPTLEERFSQQAGKVAAGFAFTGA